MEQSNTRKMLEARIRDHIFQCTQRSLSENLAELEVLGFEVLNYQRTYHPVYQRYCELSGLSEAPKRLRDFPPLPVESFKRFDLCPYTKTERIYAEFHSSTTTGQQPSIHRFISTLLLETTIYYTFTAHHRFEIISKPNLLSLMPSSQAMPQSSLAFMIDKLMALVQGPEPGHFFDLDKGLDVEGLRRALRQAEASQHPVHLMGPAYAYVHFLDAIGDERFELNPMSALLETGGYKGKSRELSREDLRDALARSLGLRRRRIYGEYGMCELSSQAYELCEFNCPEPLPEEGYFVFPPWVQCVVYDPDSMQVLDFGQEGQLAIFDLCNLDSAAFILTGDIARLQPLSRDQNRSLIFASPYAVQLKGRAANALPKGCSLTWEQWQSREKI